MYGKSNVVGELYPGLLALQHRGQDAAGITTYDKRFNLKKGNGLVQRVFNEKNLRRLRGNLGIGHVRYPTVGGGGADDAQPFYLSVPYGIAMVHNGNVTNYHKLRRELFRERFRHLNSNSDLEVILNVFADELVMQGSFNKDSLVRAIGGVFRRVKGSYSVLGIIADKGFLAFRDPHGIKPLIFGQKGDEFCFASESVALDAVGYDVVRDVQPGEAIFIDKKRRFFSKRIEEDLHTPCIFEWVYFARPDSIIDGISVYEARLRLGRELAREVKSKKIKADVVIPVPDTARAAAISLSSSIGVDFREGLIKNRYIPRTFIMPGDELRVKAIKQKLNPIRSEIEGKSVLLIDDSIVRGNTSREIIELVREAGAKKVYFGVCSPPLRYPCIYGIDMQTRGEFIARDKSIEEIRKIIGADQLIYQSLEGLLRGVGGGVRSDFCRACFDSVYPTTVSEETFQKIETERTKQGRASRQGVEANPKLN